jgi:hypothetical protein
MKNVSIGAWRERTRLAIGLSIIAAGAGMQLIQWLRMYVLFRGLGLSTLNMGSRKNVAFRNNP